MTQAALENWEVMQCVGDGNFSVSTPARPIDSSGGVRDVICDVMPHDNAKEIAALIAAAPDLLAMLKAANHALYVVGTPKAIKAALAGSKALIARAQAAA